MSRANLSCWCLAIALSVGSVAAADVGATDLLGPWQLDVERTVRAIVIAAPDDPIEGGDLRQAISQTAATTLTFTPDAMITITADGAAVTASYAVVSGSGTVLTIRVGSQTEGATTAVTIQDSTLVVAGLDGNGVSRQLIYIRP